MAGHNIEAYAAAREISHLILSDPSSVFSDAPSLTPRMSRARRDNGAYPAADSAIDVELDVGRPSPVESSLAIEYKRIEEGRHGLLTAAGQAHAYLHKGFAGVIIVIPRTYAGGRDNPAQYLSELLDLSSMGDRVGIATYDTFSEHSPDPFRGHLGFTRLFMANPTSTAAAGKSASIFAARPPQAWAHVREGEPRDAVFRFLQAMQLVRDDSAWILGALPALPSKLEAAVGRLAPGADPYKWLANVSGDQVDDRAWTRCWHTAFLHPELAIGWTTTSTAGVETYAPVSVPTRLVQDNGDPVFRWTGRSNSQLVLLADDLNARRVSIDQAYEAFGEKVRQNAHSYRENLGGIIDIGPLADLDTGELSTAGRVFVDTCLAHGSASQRALDVFAAVLLGPGQFDVLLYYIELFSRRLFREDGAALLQPDGSVDAVEYWARLDNLLLSEGLRNPASGRHLGTVRKPLQAEKAYFNKYDLAEPGKLVPGIGLDIKWSRVDELRRRYSFAS